MSALIVVLAVLGLLVVVAVVIGSRRQGTESVLVMTTDDEAERRALDEELGDTVDTGVDVEGRLSHDAIAEPDAPPPVPGAQWDEVSGRWIRWDDHTQAWVPVPPATG